ncbi:MAG: 50S ribosomal protein L11 methyltransferase [Thermodesulfobacteriota bacterium]
MTACVQVHDWILDQVRFADRRLTSHDLRRDFRAFCHLDVDIFHRTLMELVTSGVLKYSYVHGCSFLEISHDHPVKISEHVWIQPPQNRLDQSVDDSRVAITISSGSAFGLGDHPTTCLSMVLLDNLLFRRPTKEIPSAGIGLDIGTGTGILGIAMAFMGMGRVIAVDTDPCAVFEAKQNAALNRMENRMDIRHGVADDSFGPCSLITANLRLPTLLNLQERISRILTPEGFLILSGIKSSEKEMLQSFYARSGFAFKTSETRKGWTAILLQKCFS